MNRSRVRRWLRRRGIYTGRITKVRYYEQRHDLPDIPKANELAIAGTKESPKWLLLDCPCGHGHTVLLPLSKSHSPHWKLELDDSRLPSVFPSIDRNRFEGVRCHYWLKEGQIDWR